MIGLRDWFGWGPAGYPRGSVQRPARFNSLLAAVLMALSGCSEEISEDDFVKATLCAVALSAADPAAQRGAIPLSHDDLAGAVGAFGHFIVAHGQDFIDQHQAETRRIDARVGSAAVNARTEVQAMNRDGWTPQGVESLRECIRFLHDLPGSSGGGGRRR